MNRNMMRQAQKQLAQLQKIQEELEGLTVEGSAGGGVVKNASISGSSRSATPPGNAGRYGGRRPGRLEAGASERKAVRASTRRSSR